MPLWQAVILGIVQGATEFLPISSTAHLILVQRLFGRTHDQIKDDPFTITIQLGTIAAVLLYFRTDLFAMARAVWDDLRQRRWLVSGSPEGRLARLIVLGTIPAGVLGLLAKKKLEANFYHPAAIGVVAIVFALLLLAAEWWARRRAGRVLETVTWRDALFIGFFQALALMPGGSRSGTTITAGLFAGLTRPAAARFSFLLSVPVIFAAGLKDVIDKRHELTASGEMMTNLMVGLIVSGLVGYACIAWLLHFLKSSSTMVFIVYRILLGIALLCLVAGGFFADSI
jgi:undecaprenyl-diphosphatase